MRRATIRSGAPDILPLDRSLAFTREPIVSKIPASLHLREGKHETLGN